MSNQIKAGAVAILLLAGSLGGGLSGCATPPPETDTEATVEYNRTNDPAEPTNRKIFAFNDYADEHVIEPVALAYRDTLPDPLRLGLRNVLRNLGAPLTLVNDTLQGDVNHASETFTRFIMNSTVGFLGFFDTAADGDVAQFREDDFGHTLAIWGLPEGPYVMLPLLGPSNVRDATGKAVDYFMDPVGLFGPTIPFAADAAQTAVWGIDKRAENIDALKDVKKASLDYYASLRSLYRQRRAEEIRSNTSGGKTVLPDPDFSYDVPMTEESVSQR